MGSIFWILPDIFPHIATLTERYLSGKLKRKKVRRPMACRARSLFESNGAHTFVQPVTNSDATFSPY